METAPVATSLIVPSGNWIDDIFSRLVAGESAASGTEGRREFICQEGRIYARIRLGSGKKRTKENGGYIYKGHISQIEGDERWKKRLKEYATSHECHYPHPDLEASRTEPSGTRARLGRDENGGDTLALDALPSIDWESRPSGISLPS